MKDYSQFMKNKNSYILGYEIEGDEVLVYFANTDKTKPNIYPATKEVIEMLDKRMEEQYKILIDNNKTMMKNKFSKVLILSSIPLLILMVFVLANLGISNSISLYSLIIINGALITGLISKEIISAKNYEQIRTYQRYLESKDILSNSIKKDQNIARYISEEARLDLEVQQELVDKNLIDDPFNINFMDNASIKDLKEILHRLEIYKEMQEPVEYDTGEVFEETEEKHQVKRKIK